MYAWLLAAQCLKQQIHIMSIIWNRGFENAIFVFHRKWLPNCSVMIFCPMTCVSLPQVLWALIPWLCTCKVLLPCHLLSSLQEEASQKCLRHVRGKMLGSFGSLPLFWLHDRTRHPSVCGPAKSCIASLWLCMLLPEGSYWFDLAQFACPAKPVRVSSQRVAPQRSTSRLPWGTRIT